MYKTHVNNVIFTLSAGERQISEPSTVSSRNDGLDGFVRSNSIGEPIKVGSLSVYRFYHVRWTGDVSKHGNKTGS